MYHVKFLNACKTGKPNTPLWLFSSLIKLCVIFLVGAFLEKRVDYSHGFSSVFFNFFFRYTWSDQNSSTPKVLKNFKKTPNCTHWPKELNQKGFPRNIQYRTRPQAPLSVFDIARFFPGKIFSKGSPSFFSEFCDRMDVENFFPTPKNPKGSPYWKLTLSKSTFSK